MRKLLLFLVTAVVAVAAWAQQAPGNLVFVKGGAFINSKSTNYCAKNVTVSSFYIGKYEVTQKEWTEVMGNNPSQCKGDNLPVEMVTWYECIDYCNKRSIKEGLQPYYSIDKNNKDSNNTNEIDDIKWTITVHTGAGGYRLPTEAEWEYAASGGQLSKSYTYSGSDDLDKVSWYWRNSGDKTLTGYWSWPTIKENGDKTHPVGGKEPNELGLCDMSGNVREWCWDWYTESESPEIWRMVESDPKGSSSGALRVWKGGGWMGGEFCCEPSFRAGYEQYDRGPDQGIRVCRSR